MFQGTSEHADRSTRGLHNAMTKIGWTILAISLAVIFDLGLLYVWRRRQRRKELPFDTSAIERMDLPATQVQVSITLTEGQNLQLTLHALPSSEDSPGEVLDRYQISMDATTGNVPIQITLVPPPQPTTIREPLRSKIRAWSNAIMGVIRHERIRRGWERLTHSRLAFKARSARTYLLLHGWNLEIALFALAITVYTLTRLIALDDFPIYFFTDEAIQTVAAADLVNNDFRDANGRLLPTYFDNNSLFNLSFSVYIQVLPYILFGSSIFITRATSVLCTLSAAIAIALIMRNFIKIRFWWLATLLLSITPAWFLHSRTAFETVLFVSLYSLLLLFYLLYRNQNPNWLFPTILSAGLAFYSYTGGQLVIAATALLLFISDARYHWQQRRKIIAGLVLAVLLILPYLRFQLHHQGETYYHLRMLGTYWLEDVPLHEKIITFAGHYFQGLNPAYWFLPNNVDISRHIMKGYGHIIPITLPFLLVGIWKAIRNWKTSHYRTLLIAALVAPFGASIVGVGITRVLSFVIPAAMLTALGLSHAAGWLSQRWSYKPLAVLLTLVLCLTNGYMLWDSLTHGPRWFEHYGLYGMQYGAKQVFSTVEEHLESHPYDTVYVSPAWANGTHILRRFFLPPQVSVYLGNADVFLLEKRDLNDNVLLVLTDHEYEDLLLEQKITDVRVQEVLPHPDGSPGFFFVRMRYSSRADALFAEEFEARLIPVTERVEWEGEKVEVQHPQFDMGELDFIFDDDPFTLVRTFHANPARIVLTFELPKTLTGVKITTGTMDIKLTVQLYEKEANDPLTYEMIYRDLPDDPTVELSFPDQPTDVHRVEIEIEGLDILDNKIHLRDLILY